MERNELKKLLAKSKRPKRSRKRRLTLKSEPSAKRIIPTFKSVTLHTNEVPSFLAKPNILKDKMTEELMDTGNKTYKARVKAKRIEELKTDLLQLDGDGKRRQALTYGGTTQMTELRKLLETDKDYKKVKNKKPIDLNWGLGRSDNLSRKTGQSVEPMPNQRDPFLSSTENSTSEVCVPPELSKILGPDGRVAITRKCKPRKTLLKQERIRFRDSRDNGQAGERVFFSMLSGRERGKMGAKFITDGS